MRIAALSDIHSNLPALEAVFDDMPAVDAMVCAGDVIGYYTWPGACVDMVMERSIPTVMGNHDRELVSDTPFRFHGSARAGLEFADRELNEHQRSWLASLPDDRVEFNGLIRIVHGHPRNPDRYTYPEEVSPAILDDEPILVLGHTHLQFHRRLDTGLVLNPGSVGQPRDGDPRAAYAIIDTDEMAVEERRVEYDISKTQRAIRQHDLPASLAERLAEGR